MGHIGVRAGKFPMTHCVDWLDVFQLANQNVPLFGSPELAQGWLLRSAPGDGRTLRGGARPQRQARLEIASS